MAANPPKRPGQPKLRTSCDQCGAAKVKCDRGQPQCGRCDSHGRTCVYGVSRKMGKPPRVNRSGLSRTPGDKPGAGAGTGTGIADVRKLDSSSCSSDGIIGTCQSTEASTTQPTAHQSPSDANSHSDRTAMPTVSISGHDCPREAYDILRNLSFPNPNTIHSTPSSGTTPSSATNNVDNQVPLDHVLRLNSEASERLGALLSCPCARSPHLAFLYASIISRVLLWYQQAAGYTQSTSWSHATPDCSPSMGGSENTTAAAAPYTTGMAVVSAKMAIGSFNVDDLRIQTALKIQLLSGEMRTAGRLIDQFTSLNSSGQCQTDDSNFSSVDRLYQSLHSWLRGEHSRIANMMRLKLRELNT
ncbi:hypothetical protein EDB80DRAFT_595127 [Ilyonectria destructans]|nr:hypothetical protein EDB80DRAFT_595127 [Ilyonectria destructans]